MISLELLDVDIQSMRGGGGVAGAVHTDLKATMRNLSWNHCESHCSGKWNISSYNGYYEMANWLSLKLTPVF